MIVVAWFLVVTYIVTLIGTLVLPVYEALIKGRPLKAWLIQFFGLLSTGFLLEAGFGGLTTYLGQDLTMKLAIASYPLIIGGLVVAILGARRIKKANTTNL